MREFQKECERNPDFVFDQKPFDVQIKRSGGNIIMTHNKPVRTSHLMPVQKNKINDSFNAGELESLVEWLTGGEDGKRSEETDIYGVVTLKVDMDISSTLVDIAQLADEGSSDANTKKAMKDFQDLQKELINQTKGSLVLAREMADERVKRALRVTHMNLMKQYETMKSQGMGVYAPSIAEAVGAHILAAEIDKASETKARMVNRLSEIMNRTTILS